MKYLKHSLVKEFRFLRPFHRFNDAPPASTVSPLNRSLSTSHVFSKSLPFVLAALFASYTQFGRAVNLIGVDVGGGIYEIDSETGAQSPDLFHPGNPRDGASFHVMARHPQGGFLYAIIDGNRLVRRNDVTQVIEDVGMVGGGINIRDITFGTDPVFGPDSPSASPLYAIDGEGAIYKILPNLNVPEPLGWTIPGHSGFAIEWRNGNFFAFANHTYFSPGEGNISEPRFWFLDITNEELVEIPLVGANLKGPAAESANISAMVYAHSNLFYIYDSRYDAMYTVELENIVGDLVPSSAVVTEVPSPIGGGFSALARTGKYFIPVNVGDEPPSTLQGHSQGSLFTFRTTDNVVTERVVPYFDDNSVPAVSQVFQSIARHPVSGEYWVIVNDRGGSISSGAIATLDIHTGQLSKFKSLSSEVGFTGITFGPKLASLDPNYRQLFGVTFEGAIVLINTDTGMVTQSPYSSYQNPGSFDHNLEYNPDEGSLNHFFVDETYVQRMEEILVFTGQTRPAIDLSQGGDHIGHIKGVVYSGRGFFYAVDNGSIYSITTSGVVTHLSNRDGGYYVFGGLELAPGQLPINPTNANKALKASLVKKITKLRRALKMSIKRKQKGRAKLLRKQIAANLKKLRSL